MAGTDHGRGGSGSSLLRLRQRKYDAVIWQLNGFDDKVVLISLIKIVIAAIGGGMMVQVLKYPVAAMVDMQRFWGVLVQLVVAGCGGMMVYLLLAWLLKSEEVVILKKYLPRRPALKKIPAGTDTPRWEGLAE